MKLFTALVRRGSVSIIHTEQKPSMFFQAPEEKRSMKSQNLTA